MRKYFKYIAYLYVLLGFSSAIAEVPAAFYRAINLDDAVTIREYLERGADPNEPSEKGQLPLFLAMREGAHQVAEVLLAHPRIRVDAANGAGETAVMMAALRGDLDWTRRLLDRGAAVDRKGWTPLHYAASGPEPKVLALLLERGAKIDAPSPNHSTPLMMAAQYGPEAAVDLLLARGADPTLRNDAGLVAADFAQLGGREWLVPRLRRPGR